MDYKYKLRYALWEVVNSGEYIVVDTSANLRRSFSSKEEAKKYLCMMNTRELRRNQAFRKAALRSNQEPREDMIKVHAANESNN